MWSVTIACLLLSSVLYYCAKVDGCNIELGADSSVGTPTYEGNSQTTYSCVNSDDNCNYDVHVIGNYESNGHTGFRVHNTGTTNVYISVSGEGTKPLILVFESYEPVNWILSIPSGVVIERVLLGSYYLDDSDVTYPAGRVRTLERVPYSEIGYGYGTGSTLEVLQYVTERFGPVASFSGSYRADRWTLNIERRNGCNGTTVPTTSTTETTSISTTATASTTTTETTSISTTATASTTTTETTSTTTTATASTTQPATTSDLCLVGEGRSCFDGTWCPYEYYTGETCVDGYCRCVDNPDRDYCKCLAKVDGCNIELGADSSVGIPTYEGNSQTTYSCVNSDDNCNYDVHVIGNYEGDGHTGFRVHNTGTTNVYISVSGEGTKPLILVFESYEPVNWILSIPSGVVIERVLLGSYYLDDSNVTYPAGRVTTLERVPYPTLRFGHGSDIGGSYTLEVLQYVTERFGPVASFSGSYRADRWTLNIERRNDSSTGCISGTTAPPTTTTEATSILTTTATTTTATTETTTCVDGYCRCVDNPDRDCTCLAKVDGCNIELGADTSVGIPTYEGNSQTTYSCVNSDDNCNYDVHVIGNYEGNGHTGFQVHNTGTTNVYISVSGEGIRPLILVFESYEPVNWILSIPSGVVIERVLLGSYYLDDSDVTYPAGRVRTLERVPYSEIGYGYGTGSTLEVLQYVTERFGPVASFSGSYRADRWTLNIERRNGCSDLTLTCTRPATTATDASKGDGGSTVGGAVGGVGVVLVLALLIVGCASYRKRRTSTRSVVPPQMSQPVVRRRMIFPKTPAVTVPFEGGTTDLMDHPPPYPGVVTPYPTQPPTSLIPPSPPPYPGIVTPYPTQPPTSLIPPSPPPYPGIVTPYPTQPPTFLIPPSPPPYPGNPV